MPEIQITPGNWRRRDGTIAENVRRRDDFTYFKEFPWTDKEFSWTDIEGKTYKDNGAFYGSTPYDFDLIERIDPPPAKLIEPVKGREYFCSGYEQPLKFTGGVAISGKYIFESEYTGILIQRGPVEVLREHTPPVSMTVDLILLRHKYSGYVFLSAYQVGYKPPDSYEELNRETVTVTERKIVDELANQ